MLRIVEYYFLYSSNLKCFSRQNKKKQKNKKQSKNKNNFNIVNFIYLAKNRNPQFISKDYNSLLERSESLYVESKQHALEHRHIRICFSYDQKVQKIYLSF
jgi:hypothetical protein